MNNCYFYSKTDTKLKNINSDILTSSINSQNFSVLLQNIMIRDNDFVVVFENDLTSEEIIILNNLVSNHEYLTTQEQYRLRVSNCISFGQEILLRFTTENVQLGITADGMTNIVRKNTEQIVSALATGSLLDAIAEVRNIPEENKDSKYITNERLLNFINEIETYLNLPLSSSL